MNRIAGTVAIGILAVLLQTVAAQAVDVQPSIQEAWSSQADTFEVRRLSEQVVRLQQLRRRIIAARAIEGLHGAQRQTSGGDWVPARAPAAATPPAHALSPEEWEARITSIEKRLGLMEGAVDTLMDVTAELMVRILHEQATSGDPASSRQPAAAPRWLPSSSTRTWP